MLSVQMYSNNSTALNLPNTETASLIRNDAARINELTPHRARLVLGWVTVSAFSSRCGTFPSHPGQLSLAIPTWVTAVSTSQKAVTLCGWGVKAGMVGVWVAGKTV